MSAFRQQKNRRILIVDDNASIHDDFREVLCEHADVAGIDDLEDLIFSAPAAETAERPRFELMFAHQGEEALELVRESLQRGQPYALVFMDIRMPPGWDGIETLRRVRRLDPRLQAVLCSAYADYSWNDIVQQFGPTDGLLILRKPFDTVEVLQLACALTEKWNQQADLAAAHRQLAAQYDAAKTLVNAIPDMVLRFDSAGRCVECNTASASFLSLRIDELPGKSVHEVFPSDVASSILGCAARAHEARAVSVVEYTREVNGRTSLYEARVCASEGLVVIVRDVSEQRQLEAERLSNETRRGSSRPACDIRREAEVAGVDKTASPLRS